MIQNALSQKLIFQGKGQAHRQTHAITQHNSFDKGAMLGKMDRKAENTSNVPPYE